MVGRDILSPHDYTGVRNFTHKMCQFEPVQGRSFNHTASASVWLSRQSLTSQLTARSKTEGAEHTKEISVAGVVSSWQSF